MTAFLEVLKISLYLAAALGAVLILAVTPRENEPKALREKELYRRKALPLKVPKKDKGTAAKWVTRTREIKKLEVYQKLNNKKAEIAPIRLG